MNYVCQNKTPEELLKKVGFEKAVDRGWRIVITPNSRKFDTYNKETWIPKSRLHAIFFENNLNIHFDQGLKKRKHKAHQRHNRVIEIMEKLKRMDYSALIKIRVLKYPNSFPKALCSGCYLCFPNQVAKKVSIWKGDKIDGIMHHSPPKEIYKAVFAK